MMLMALVVLLLLVMNYVMFLSDPQLLIADIRHPELVVYK